MLMAAGKAAMTTTVSEVYFLVRVGSWGDDDLENYIQERIDNALDETYETVYNEGYEQGKEDGKEEMYKEAVDAVKCLR